MSILNFPASTQGDPEIALRERQYTGTCIEDLIDTVRRVEQVSCGAGAIKALVDSAGDSCGGTCAGRHGIGAIPRDSLTAHTGAETQAAQSAGIRDVPTLWKLAAVLTDKELKERRKEHDNETKRSNHSWGCAEKVQWQHVYP